MSVTLLYHKDDGTDSVFDCHALEIAAQADLCIACPYLSLKYLKRLTSIANNWRLISDIDEWMGSTPMADRPAVVAFISENLQFIRDCQGLHAKVIVGNNLAMFGSANFTLSGMTRKTEMGCFMRGGMQVREISKWFDALWASAEDVGEADLNQLSTKLPTSIVVQRRPPLAIDKSVRNVPLVPNQEPKDVLQYYGARGFYTGNGRQFCVLKGSPARFEVIKSFTYTGLRERLIELKVLARKNPIGDYEFTQDYLFDSPSAAACIVSGQSRNGRKEWTSAHS